MSRVRLNRFLRQCESPACSRTGRVWRAWLELRHGSSLDGRWYCSPECLEQALVSAISQSLPTATRPPAKAHRVPLGLLLLSRGLVDNEQLQMALKAQRDSGSGRLGEWLRHMGAVSEEQVTQILGSQWSIPVFPLNQSQRFLECAHLVPFPLLEVAVMLPVHHISTSQHLYVAFIDRVNYSALYAVERMLACHTEPCLASQSQVLEALNQLRARPHPVEVLVDNVSDPGEMANSIMAHSARLGSTEIKVSGFDGFIWARLFAQSQFTDLLFQAQKDQPQFIIPGELQA